jgi:hypothetical protein
MSKNKINTGFYAIFKDKLDKIKSELKKEFERAKTDRRKHIIKQHIKDIKSLRKAVKEMEDALDIKSDCPHCGGKL